MKANRAELAAAIKDSSRIEAEQAARRAVLDRASALVDKALQELETARAEAARARAGKTAALVDAASTGAPLTPEPSSREARNRLADAEEEWEAAVDALAAIQKSAAPFDNSLSEAQARVRACAATIMGGAIDQLLHDAATLNASLAEKRLALQAILRTLDRNTADYERVNWYLAAPIFPAQLSPEAHPVTLAWRQAFDALQRDASTELPK